MQIPIQLYSNKAADQYQGNHFVGYTQISGITSGRICRFTLFWLILKH